MKKVRVAVSKCIPEIRSYCRDDERTDSDLTSFHFSFVRRYYREKFF